MTDVPRIKHEDPARIDVDGTLCDLTGLGETLSTAKQRGPGEPLVRSRETGAAAAADSPMKHSCSLLIRKPDDRYLLIRRSLASRNFPGWWEFPGGKMDAGESVYGAMRREVKEEIGIDLPGLPRAPERHICIPGEEVEYDFFSWTCPSPGPAEISGQPIVLSDEHSAFRWATLAEARELPMVQVHREFLEWKTTGTRPSDPGRAA